LNHSLLIFDTHTTLGTETGIYKSMPDKVICLLPSASWPFQSTGLPWHAHEKNVQA